MIELEAAFQPVFGTHKTTEVILWQRVVNTKAVHVDAGPRPAAGGVRTRNLAARRAGGPRPLGEPAAAQRRLVTPVLSLMASNDRSTCPRPSSTWVTVPRRHRSPDFEWSPEPWQATDSGSPWTASRAAWSASSRRTPPGTPGNATRPARSWWCLLSGRVDLVQEIDGSGPRRRPAAGPGRGQPANVWHTARVHEPGSGPLHHPGRGHRDQAAA